MQEQTESLEVAGGAASNGISAPPRSDKGEPNEQERTMPPEFRLPSCDPPFLLAPMTDVLMRISRLRGRPLFVLASEFIDENVAEEIYSWRKKLKAVGAGDNLDILVHSPGGELTACYRIARLFARYTNDWQALVPDYAASGATLICLGSSNIVMSDIAQLGPLDPQVISKRNTKFFTGERQSPLEAFQAVKYLREYTLTVLDASIVFLFQRQVAPQLALETASKLAVEVAKPILDKIEPYDLGAFGLDSSLAIDYCRRICEPKESSKQTQSQANYRALVEKYPAHEFVIDTAEAESLGLNVCEPDEELNDLIDELRVHLRSLRSYIGFVPQQAEGDDDDESAVHAAQSTEPIGG